MMRSKGLVLGLAMAAAVPAARAPAETRTQGGRIPAAEIEAMFANMKAQTSWDLGGPLTWGYYFLDPKKEKLETAAKELQRMGYAVIELRSLSPDAPLGADWQLHVQKVERQTPESLEARDEELYQFALAHGLKSYDGPDVGPAP